MAFALAENLDEYFPKEVTGYLVTTTLLIVLFTIIILGGSTMPLLKVLLYCNTTNMACIQLVQFQCSSSLVHNLT